MVMVVVMTVIVIVIVIVRMFVWVAGVCHGPIMARLGAFCQPRHFSRHKSLPNLSPCQLSPECQIVLRSLRWGFKVGDVAHVLHHDGLGAGEYLGQCFYRGGWHDAI